MHIFVFVGKCKMLRIDRPVSGFCAVVHLKMSTAEGIVQTPVAQSTVNLAESEMDRVGGRSDHRVFDLAICVTDTLWVYPFFN